MMSRTIKRRPTIHQINIPPIISFISSPTFHFERSALDYFSLARSEIAIKIKAYEKLHENSVFDSGLSHLRGSFCGGHADVPQRRQGLSDERRQEMQLREDLRL